MVVEKVPSMHVLITAVADLIMPAHLERRIFAVNLVAELALKVCQNFMKFIMSFYFSTQWQLLCPRSNLLKTF